MQFIENIPITIQLNQSLPISFLIKYHLELIIMQRILWDVVLIVVGEDIWMWEDGIYGYP